MGEKEMIKEGTKIWFEIFGARVKGIFLKTVKDSIEVLVGKKRMIISNKVRLGKIL